VFIVEVLCVVSDGKKSLIICACTYTVQRILPTQKILLREILPFKNKCTVNNYSTNKSIKEIKVHVFIYKLNISRFTVYYLVLIYCDEKSIKVFSRYIFLFIP